MQSNYLPTDYQSFIHTSRYARWVEDEDRREQWPETVDRYMRNVISPKIKPNTFDDYVIIGKIRDAILNLSVMPSMRALMTAGPALERDNTAGYNCSYLPVDSLRSFDEAMFILLCGAGVGFSVEHKYTEQLPMVPKTFHTSGVKILVPDHKEGWAETLKMLLSLLFKGAIPEWDLSLIRKKGAKLKTFGGRASGPEPLDSLLNFTVELVTNAAGRRLRPIECHDLMCKIAEIVVVGGVRRSAMISLSDLGDEEMARAKSGKWYEKYPHRALANNSAVYEGKPTKPVFKREWQNLIDSGSGERGIFNREACNDIVYTLGKRKPNEMWGTNPCSEIILRPFSFCNLSEVVIRPEDTFEDIRRKVIHATIIGTIQSTMTHFPYLRDRWRINAEDERLLGVSLTGIMDNPVTSNPESLAPMLKELKSVAVETNRLWAKRLGINAAAAITCVKPSGTVSQLVDSASGIHARYAPYYIRTVRGDNNDPLTEFMRAQGIPAEPCVMKPDSTTVFSFPIKSPDNAVTSNDRTAIEQLELWQIYQRHWCEHKPSVTISVSPNEWQKVGDWVYDNFFEMTGVSFLPYFDHSYQQAPYQEIAEDEYQRAVSRMPPKIDWSKLASYEKEDTTKSAQTLACTAGMCELVDVS